MDARWSARWVEQSSPEPCRRDRSARGARTQNRILSISITKDARPRHHDGGTGRVIVMVGRPKRVTLRARPAGVACALHLRHFLFLPRTAMSPRMKMHRWSIAVFALTSSAAL